MEEQQVREKYRRITRELIRSKLHITTMESCTSGQIASLITDTEGASAVLKGAFVTYSNEAKILQGVPEEILDTYGVYSPETAAAMAEACAAVYGAELAIGITGTMGNVDPVNRDSIPGIVFFAVLFRGVPVVRRAEIPPMESRPAYKLAAADAAADVLLEILGL